MTDNIAGLFFNLVSVFFNFYFTERKLLDLIVNFLETKILHYSAGRSRDLFPKSPQTFRASFECDNYLYIFATPRF